MSKIFVLLTEMEDAFSAHIYKYNIVEVIRDYLSFKHTDL